MTIISWSSTSIAEEVNKTTNVTSSSVITVGGGRGAKQPAMKPPLSPQPSSQSPSSQPRFLRSRGRSSHNRSRHASAGTDDSDESVSVVSAGGHEAAPAAGGGGSTSDTDVVEIRIGALKEELKRRMATVAGLKKFV